MSEEWNVDVGAFGCYGYRDFINRLRRELSTSISSFGVPHLIPEQEFPTQFLDVRLRSRDSHVTLRLRRDNVYLIGYRMQDGRWVEFGREGERHLIEGSTFLGFDGLYGSMARVAYEDRVTNDNLPELPEGLQVSSSSLVEAVAELATTDNRPMRARRLMVVIFMVCEAIRIIPIQDHIASGYRFSPFDPQSSRRVERWIVDAVHTWGSFSDLLLNRDADPNALFRGSDLRTPPAYRIVEGIGQIVAILGVMLINRTLSRASPNRKLGRRMLQLEDHDRLQGQPRVEVFSVRMDNVDNEDPGQLYGTITVNDGLTQNIYNRPRSNVESIRPGQSATLVGPHRSIWASGGFTIRFLLTDSDSWTPDDEVVHDTIEWNAFDFRNAPRYDKPISQQLKGKYGSATVNYAVLRNASMALVTINLQEGGEDIVEVYGSVVANYSDWDSYYTNCTSVLFSRPKEDYLQVRRWQNIPLLKYIVAVPLGSSLRVTADLYDYDPVSADDKIAIGSVEFPARMSGGSSQKITGEDGNLVTVTVSWGEAIAPDGDPGYSHGAPHPRNEL